MFCSNCGNQIEEGTKFCPSCGKEAAFNSNVIPPTQQMMETPPVPKKESRNTAALVFTFTKAAAEKFEKITSEHMGESIGIYVNDDMVSNPVVQSVISGGTAQITDNISYEEANNLAKILKNTK